MPKDTTNLPVPPKVACTMHSSDSSTGPITCLPLEISTSILPSDGPLLRANLGSVAGLSYIRALENGTAELNTILTHAVTSEISSVIESYISTVLTPYLRKLSPGDLKVQSQKYVLEVRSGFENPYRGPSFSFKYTIALFSRSLERGRERALLSIPLDKLSKILCPTTIHSSSSGVSPAPTSPGGSANE